MKLRLVKGPSGTIALHVGWFMVPISADQARAIGEGFRLASTPGTVGASEVEADRGKVGDVVHNWGSV